MNYYNNFCKLKTVDEVTCGYCGCTDGLVYTSNPPQCKCNINGNFYFFGDECHVKNGEGHHSNDDDNWTTILTTNSLDYSNESIKDLFKYHDAIMITANRKCPNPTYDIKINPKYDLKK